MRPLNAKQAIGREKSSGFEFLKSITSEGVERRAREKRKIRRGK